MVKGVANFSGEKLTEARLASGLRKNALADKIGVTSMAITRYEANQDRPTQDNLEAIAIALAFPVEFFTRKAWSESLGTVFWRDQVAETKAAREMTEQRMKWLCELFWTLEEELDFPEQAIPEVDLPSDVRLISPVMIEKCASELRRQWQLRSLPIRDVVLSVENAGIPVAMLDIPSEKQDGFFFRSPLLKRSFIGVNVHSATAARARFDVAHELGHLVLHKNVTAEQNRDPDLHKIIEKQAHRFAGAFLFPKESFWDEVTIPSLDYFCALKKRWGMSIAAMIARAFDLGMIDVEAKKRLYISMNRRDWRQPEPFDDVMVMERPRMLRRGVEALVASGDYSQDFLEHMLALPRKEILQLVGLTDAGMKSFDSVSYLLKPPTVVEATDLETGEIVRFPQRLRS
ncbi:Zn-dependent peptidase ImmA (M78 family)/DNA-binding XRE family transcriptional regulator [Rhizobium sp. BK591]|uniref:XRE family transcriptional regulator n=1 Tax=Rhizobium sp. BK591 TaxID=2586985 RepID=UPI00105234ED|nr:XRE family transcriptional regulator [Rhizobium sp. BK591]MBB3746988.1 Zn-dependent peptidase ImmA (M78 family)/DNA-binding XRE family transcriptional regulator [Rhizobium sp. BK591]